MILRPLDPQPSGPVPAYAAKAAELTKSQPVADGLLSAWGVVAQRQGVAASRFLLVGQPDHAKLSGELAASFTADFLPKIDDEVVRAIGLHDEGWAQFPFERDLREEPATKDGRPQSFLEVTVEESLSAWTGSIEAGGKVSPLGEYVVSGHFWRIGRMRLAMAGDTPEDRAKVQAFVDREGTRQKALSSKLRLADEELSAYVDLLQFSDVLSLYLCCGATEAVEFPQSFVGQKVQVRYHDGVFVSSPALFADTQRFQLPVRLWPSSNGQDLTNIGFHIK